MVCRGPQLILDITQTIKCVGVFPPEVNLLESLQVENIPPVMITAWDKNNHRFTHRTHSFDKNDESTAQVSAALFLPGNSIYEFQHLDWSHDVCWTELYLLLLLLLPLWPSMPSTPSATTANSTTYPSAFTTTAITSYHFKTQSLTSLCTNPSPPPPSRSNWKSNLSWCCVQVERRTATTACSLFRSLSTAHICIDLSSFWARGTGGSNTKRLIPIDLHRALRFHSSFIW